MRSYKAGKPKTSSLLGYREDNVTIPNDHRCPGRNHTRGRHHPTSRRDIITLGRRPLKRPSVDAATYAEALATGGRESVRGSVSRKDRWSVAHGTRDERCERKGRWIKGIINLSAGDRRTRGTLDGRPDGKGVRSGPGRAASGGFGDGSGRPVIGSVGERGAGGMASRHSCPSLLLASISVSAPPLCAPRVRFSSGASCFGCRSAVLSLFFPPPAALRLATWPLPPVRLHLTAARFIYYPFPPPPPPPLW